MEMRNDSVPATGTVGQGCQEYDFVIGVKI